nr:MAG TPA: hypothetical protein [Caudoviricetes sp.]DAV96492.1 MAG TPA: hypothetical protein [Caudoviricetes sp.]DAX07249.1 MAG TPA: hypothetical protein [Bacteriophage sp.]DAZ43677.1 MAG TPA: hypothetical protein [Caudoviricetes sp.]
MNNYVVQFLTLFLYVYKQNTMIPNKCQVKS